MPSDRPVPPAPSPYQGPAPADSLAWAFLGCALASSLFIGCGGGGLVLWWKLSTVPGPVAAHHGPRTDVESTRPFIIERPPATNPSTRPVEPPELPVEELPEDPPDPVAEAPVDLKGRLVFGSPKPVPIRPPLLEAARQEVRFPGPIDDLAVGGGGRFLIAHVPSRKELAIFDVSEAKIVHTLPLPDEPIRFAANMDRLIIVLVRSKELQRWCLLSGEKEAVAPYQMKAPVIAAAMGHASNGPLMLNGLEFPRLGETAFFDPLTLRRLDEGVDPHHVFHTGPDYRVRAAPDGLVFACSGFRGMQSLLLTGRGYQTFLGVRSFPVPSEDHCLYTQGAILNAYLRQIGGPSGTTVPAGHGPWCVALPDGKARHRFELCVPMDHRPLALLPEVEELGPLGYSKDAPLTADQRILLIPAAKQFITIPAALDRLVMHPFDVEAAVQASGTDSFYITSGPLPSATPGIVWSHRLTARTRPQEGVSIRLVSGPPGLEVRDSDTLVWNVPVDQPQGVEPIAVIARSGGRHVSLALRLPIVRP